MRDGGRGKRGGGADHGVAVGRELLAGADNGLRREAVEPARRLVQEQDGGGATRREGGIEKEKIVWNFKCIEATTNTYSLPTTNTYPYKHKTGQNHASIAYVQIAASFARRGGNPAHKTNKK